MKKILIFRHASLGDFIVGIPAITMIRKKFLNHKIYYLTTEHTKPGAVNPNTILNNNKLIKNKFLAGGFLVFKNHFLEIPMLGIFH